MLLFLFSFSPVSCSTFFIFIQVQWKKSKNKKIVENIKYESHEELCGENMINIQRLSALGKQHRKIIWKFSQLPFMHIIRPVQNFLKPFESFYSNTYSSFNINFKIMFIKRPTAGKAYVYQMLLSFKTLVASNFFELHAGELCPLWSSFHWI